MRIPILILALAARAAAQSSVEDQVKQTLELIAAHRAAVPRLTPIAEASAQVLLKGGNLFICCGENPWISEGESRAGGPIGIKVARTPSQVTENSVVWVSYNKDTYQSIRSYIERMPRNTLVVAFGPKPESSFPAAVQWVDSLNPWNAPANLTLMGNVLSLWSLSGEAAAATARAGKTMAFYQSAWLPAANERNQRYAGLTFHKRLPIMQPVEPGVLAGSYLEAIATMSAAIAESELPYIRATGRIMADRAAAGKPATLVVTSHLMSGIAATGSPLYRFEADAAKLATKISREDYVVSLGYSSLDSDLYKAVHRAGAGAAWALASTVKPTDPPSAKDIFIDQHWDPGDAAVTVWAYDVPILPPSGIAQLFLYELLLRAAEAAH